MTPWDRRTPAQLAKLRDAAVREQVTDAVAPFSPFWRERLGVLGLAPGDIGSVAALSRLPAVGERDVCPDGDPAGMAGLVLQPTERGYMVHAPGEVVRRALLRRVVDRDGYRRMVEADTRPTSYVFAGLGMRFPVASTRSDLDLVARAGARLWSVLGLTSADVLVSAVPVEATTEHVALQYAALAAGAPALFPGSAVADVAATLRLAGASVLAAPSDAAADLVDDLVTAGADLAGVTTLLLVGAPTDAERRAAAEALRASGAPSAAVVLGVHAPSAARVLWGECRQSAGAPTGLHTYPDLDVVETVDPETGERSDSGGEPVLTQLGFRGTALLRWRTGDVVPEPLAVDACPACGRTVARVPSTLRRRALVVPHDTGAVDLRAVAAALTGRPDVRDWRVVVSPRAPHAGERMVVHLVAAGGDPQRVVAAAAADIRVAAGVAPDRFVIAAAGALPAPDRGTALTARLHLRR